MIEIARDDRHAPPPGFFGSREGYAELCVTTNFTFLTGASHPEEMMTRAAELGLTAIAITDRNSLAGVVRAYRALQVLREEAEDRLRIRSQHRIDTCSRQEIGKPQDLPRPDALHRTAQIADRCGFDLGQLSYDYPDEATNGEAPMARLTRLAQEGLARRYPNGATDRARQLMAKELAVVQDLNFPAYFLTVHDIVQYARSQGILCQGRGSAANSILCYLLGISTPLPDV